MRVAVAAHSFGPTKPTCPSLVRGVTGDNALSTVSNVDVLANNGVVHQISRVLLPANTVIDVLNDNAIFSVLSDLLKKNSRSEALSSDGPFTVCT